MDPDHNNDDGPVPAFNKRKQVEDTDEKESKARRIDEEPQSIDTNISTIFVYDHLAIDILSFLPVSDLITCREVSKKWLAHTNNDIMWLQKYKAQLGIVVDSPAPGTKPEGYYRRMFLYRFGREDLVNILSQNYTHTNNIEYLTALETLATATAETYNRFCAAMSFAESEEPAHFIKLLEEATFFFNKLIIQHAEYDDASISSENNTRNSLHATATLYSNRSTRQVKIGIKTVHVWERRIKGEVNILALHDDSSTAEHLCKFLSFREEKAEAMNSQYIEFDTGIYVAAIEDACQKVLTFLDCPSITPSQLVYALKWVTKINFSGGDLEIAHKEALPHDGGAENHLRTNYNQLAYRSRGDLQLLQAKETARKKNLNPLILSLIANTSFIYYNETCGLGNEDEFALNYENRSIFKLVLPNHEPLEIESVVSNYDMPWFNYEYDYKNNSTLWATVKMGDKTSSIFGIEIEFDKQDQLQFHALRRFVNKLKVPGLTPEILFTYIATVGNFLDQLFAPKHKEVEWWTLEPLNGVTLELVASNATREPLYYSTKEAAKELMKEIHWDEKQQEDEDEGSESDESQSDCRMN